MSVCDGESGLMVLANGGQINGRCRSRGLLLLCSSGVILVRVIFGVIPRAGLMDGGDADRFIRVH